MKTPSYSELVEELRECRATFDALISERPQLVACLRGSTTVGNRRAEVHSLIMRAGTDPVCVALQAIVDYDTPLPAGLLKQAIAALSIP